MNKKNETQSSIFRGWFTTEDQSLDYGAINRTVKVVGFLVSTALVIFIFQTIMGGVFTPIFRIINVVSPFIFGIVFASLFTPMVSKLVDLGWSKRMASLVVTLGGVLFLSTLFVGFFYVTVSSFVNFFTGGFNIAHFLDTGENLIEYINQNINSTLPRSGLLELFIQVGQFFNIVDGTAGNYQIVFDTNGQIPSLLGNVGSYAWQTVITVMVVAFLLPNFARFRRNVKKIAPIKYKDSWGTFVDIVAKSFAEYMRGALLIALIVGSTLAVGATLISILSSTIFYQVGTSSILNYQTNGALVLLTILVFGLVLMTTNLIPYAGPFIGGVPVVMIVALNDTTPNYWVTWSMAAMIVFVQSLESLFLQPYVMGKQTKLHPVTILLGLAIFGSIFGLVGFLISTPIISIGRGLLRYYKRKSMSETE
jgi:predicted PurR-regulated permease PerM